MLLPLCSKISKYFPSYRCSCLKNILILYSCILVKGTLNLHQLKSSVSLVLHNSTSLSQSNYKRLLRIFEFYSLSRLYLDILIFIFHLVGIKGDYLLLDGTSWKRSQKCYHYLTLAIVYEGMVIPIYWLNLYKMAVSHTQERIRVIKKALKYFDLQDKTYLAN